jgi:hypothetical protein
MDGMLVSRTCRHDTDVTCTLFYFLCGIGSLCFITKQPLGFVMAYLRLHTLIAGVAGSHVVGQ